MPGWYKQDGTQDRPSFLASDYYELVSITIDSGARDTANTDTDDLRSGLILVKETGLASGHYTTLTTTGSSNTADLRTAVVLAYDIKDIAAHTEADALLWGDIYEANCYYNGKSTAPITNAQKDMIQRIMFRP